MYFHQIIPCAMSFDSNEFSHAVGEEYLKFFDFNNQSLEQALR